MLKQCFIHCDQLEHSAIADSHTHTHWQTTVIDCKIMCPHAYTCAYLDVTLHATICKHIHLVHMETSHNVVCKDRTSADNDYSYFIDVLSSKS